MTAGWPDGANTMLTVTLESAIQSPYNPLMVQVRGNFSWWDHCRCHVKVMVEASYSKPNRPHHSYASLPPIRKVFNYGPHQSCRATISWAEWFQFSGYSATPEPGDLLHVRCMGDLDCPTLWGTNTQYSPLVRQTLTITTPGGRSGLRLTGEPVLRSPDDLRVKPEQPGWFRLLWTEVPGADYYEEHHEGHQRITTGPHTELFAVPPGDQRTVLIRAVGPAGFSEWVRCIIYPDGGLEFGPDDHPHPGPPEHRHGAQHDAITGSSPATPSTHDFASAPDDAPIGPHLPRQENPARSQAVGHRGHDASTPPCPCTRPH